MRGEKAKQESIESRIASGEKVCLQFWTKVDEVGVWILPMVFVGMDAAFLFIEDGSATIFLAMLPFCLLPFGLIMFKRKDRVGRDLVLSESGINLKVKGSFDIAIPWEALDGLYKKMAGTVILSRNGTEILVPHSISGIKHKQQQTAITDYLIKKSRWIDEKRELYPKPLPMRKVRGRLFFWSSISIISIILLMVPFRYFDSIEINMDNVQLITLTLSGIAAVCAFATVAVFRAVQQLSLHKYPHLWDRSIPTPPGFLSTGRIQQDLPQAKQFDGSTKTSNISAELISTTWLTRTWQVCIESQEFEVTYDGRGWGFEEVRVNGITVCRTPSSGWFVPRFDFLIGAELTTVAIRANALFRVIACKLIIDDTVLYKEGRI